MSLDCDDDTMTCVHVLYQSEPYIVHLPSSEIPDCDAFCCQKCYDKMNIGVDTLDDIILIDNHEFAKIKPTLQQNGDD